MFDFKNYTENSSTRPRIYCVWIPAYPGKETPLIRVWIDPSMSAFEPQAAIPDRGRGWRADCNNLLMFDRVRLLT